MPGAHDDGANGRSDGSSGVGVAVAGILVAFFATFPFILIAVLYLFVTIYAIVRALGPEAGANPVPVVVGFVLITSAFVVLIGVTIHFVGRAITPKRSRSTD
jgi:hypothetical protein